MSNVYSYNSNTTSTLMSELECSKEYILSTYRNGYKIVIDESPITFLCNYGDKKLLHEKCNRLIEVFDKLI